jgi:hypothetical protein
MLPRLQPVFTRDACEEIALNALGYIASDRARAAAFIAGTGILADQMRQAARQPEFLAGVLAYLTEREPLLLAFAADYSVEPDNVVEAARVLAGQ